MSAGSAARHAAAEFAALFPAGSVTPVELGGMTAVLRSICPGEITAKMIAATGRLPLSHEDLQLDEGQRESLGAGPDEPAYRRSVLLIDVSTGRAAAWTSAVVLLRRVPWHCRVPLGLTRAGSPDPGKPTLPLGTALSHRGIYRSQTATVLTPGAVDDDGRSQVLYSEALLSGTKPVALVTERLYGDFLDQYPPPWPAVPAVLRDAA